MAQWIYMNGQFVSMRENAKVSVYDDTARHRGGGYTARLIDRTDGNPVSVEFFSVERPLIGEPQSADEEFVGPPRGGLLWQQTANRSRARSLRQIRTRCGA